MKPEWRRFKVIAGEFFEDDDGSRRQCIPISTPPIRYHITEDLRRDYGFEVALGRNAEFALDYLVAARPEGTFRAPVLDRLLKTYGAMYRREEEPDA